MEYEICIKDKDGILVLNLAQKHNELDKIEELTQEKTDFSVTIWL